MSAASKKPASKSSKSDKPGKARKPGKPDKLARDFTALVDVVTRVHNECAAAVNRTVNTTLTLRNWAIGYHIGEYEFHGADRAKYGDRIIDALAKALAERGISRCDRRELYRYRLFQKTYPQIVEAATPLLGDLWRGSVGTVGTGIQTEIVESVTPQFNLSGPQLLKSLSFTHFAELIEIDDPLKRAFYEIDVFAATGRCGP